MTRKASKNFSPWWRCGVVLAALVSTAAMPPISEHARAALDRTLGAKGVYIAEESAHKFAFPRTDLSVQVGRQRLSSALWKQGTALELARGLRFALDVAVGAAKVASNSGRMQ